MLCPHTTIHVQRHLIQDAFMLTRVETLNPTGSTLHTQTVRFGPMILCPNTAIHVKCHILQHAFMHT
jgi:hypothetical protein